MRGYWGDAKSTEESFYIRPSDGSKWYRTGDVASIDSKGWVVVSHRVKDVIKVKGFQVSPAELESLLFQHPKVQDVAVCGIFKDAEKTMQAPWAFVVASSDKPDKDLEQELLNATNAQLTEYKRIQGITWLEALPKSASGKVLKKDLVAAF